MPIQELQEQLQTQHSVDTGCSSSSSSSSRIAGKN
jgi:hypothetical protein